MPIQNSSDKNFNLNADLSASDFIEGISKFEPTVGIFGGIKFSYEGTGNHSASLNALIKKGISIARRILHSNPQFLNIEDEKNIQSILEQLENLKTKRINYLNDEKQCSTFQRILTRIRSTIGSLLYNREKDLTAMQDFFRSAKNSTLNFVSNISRRAGNLSDYSDDTIENFLKVEKQRYPHLIKLEYMRELVVIFISNNFNYVLKNLHLFDIDPSTEQGKKDLYVIIKRFTKHPSNEHLFLALHEQGFSSIPRMQDLLLEFVNVVKIEMESNSYQYGLVSGEKLKMEFLKKLGLDPISNRNVFLECTKTCLKIGLRKIGFNNLVELGVSPLNNSGLEIWTSMIANTRFNRYSDGYSLSHSLKKILDLTKEDQLQIYIQLLKIFFDKRLSDFPGSDIGYFTGLNDDNSLETLKISTKFIQGIGSPNETWVNQTIFSYLNIIDFKGTTKTEQNYLKWLLGEASLNFDIHYTPQFFDKYPPEVLHDIVKNLDTKSLMRLRSTTPHGPIMQQVLWVEWFKRGDRPSENNLADLTNLQSQASTIYHIQKYGPFIDELDLTGLFYFPDSIDTWQRLEVIDVLNTTLKSCSRLKILRISDNAFIDDDLISLLPDTLHTLILEKCKVSFSCLDTLPESIDTLTIKKINFEQVPLKISDNIKFLKITKARSLSNFNLPKNILELEYERSRIEPTQMVELPDSLEKFTFPVWSGTFKELVTFLPKNLKNLTCSFPDFTLTKEDVEAIPESLQELNFLASNVLLQSSITQLPSCIKKLPPVLWHSTFNELLPLLPPTLQELRIDNMELSNMNLDELPKNITSLRFPSDCMFLKETEPFPAHIKFLNIAAWEGTLQELFPLLPENIKKLTIYRWGHTSDSEFSGGFTDTDIQSLPKPLKVLELSALEYRKLELSDGKIQEIKNKGIELKIDSEE